MKRKFIITRHNWLWGKQAEGALRVNKEMIQGIENTNIMRKETGQPPYRVPRLGMMCVMGQVGCQLGIPKKRLNGHGALKDVEIDDLDQSIQDEVNEIMLLAGQAYIINDDSSYNVPDRTRQQIELELQELFADNEYELIFTQ